MADVAERFWAKVDKRGPDECWPWIGFCKPSGYGQFWWDGTMRQAHRVAWILTRGEIPDGLYACHHCDNPPCVNPAHLWLGTRAENRRDQGEKGRDQFPRPWQQGERHWSAKLSAEDVAEIRREYAAGGVTQTALAARYGIRNGHVSRIIRREVWATESEER